MEDYWNMSTATEYPEGMVFDLLFEEFSVRLSSLPGREMLFHIADGPFARTEKVSFDVSTLRPGVFLVSWQEASRATVVHLEDFVEMVVHSYATLPDGGFLKMQAPIRMVDHGTGAAP